MLTIQLDFVVWKIALDFNTIVVSLFLKLLGIIKILLANRYLFSEIKK